MKKIFLAVFAFSFLATSFISCQSNQKDQPADSTKMAAADTSKKVDSAKSSSAKATVLAEKEIARSKDISAPDFSNAEVNEGIKEFSGIKEAYVSALAQKDADAIKIAKDKFNAWALKAATWGSKLPKKENQKYIDYYEKLALQWEIAGQTGTKK